MKKKLITITIGDIEGIGIELLINIWKKNSKVIGNFILITNYNFFINFLKKKNINIPLVRINNINELKYFDKKKFNIFNIEAKNDVYNTYNSLLSAYDLTKKQICKYIITLPINKMKIIKKIDKNFIGQTELFKKLDNKKHANMIFYSKKIITTSLTSHVPLITAIKLIKKKNYYFEKIITIYKLLKNDLKINKPKIAIAGINPHAGEGGSLGLEEIKYLNPIINNLKKLKINIDGPFAADSLFIDKNLNKYNCFICIYHDQALIPFKTINKFSGVNLTGSLNIIRTSPVHGTGYDQVGKNTANSKSLIDSFKLAEKIYKNRLN